MNASQSIFVAPLLGLLWATNAVGACGGSDGATINADGADASTGTGQPSPDGAVASSGDGAATATDATTPSPPPNRLRRWRLVRSASARRLDRARRRRRSVGRSAGLPDGHAAEGVRAPQEHHYSRESYAMHMLAAI